MITKPCLLRMQWQPMGQCSCCLYSHSVTWSSRMSEKGRYTTTQYAELYLR